MARRGRKRAATQSPLKPKAAEEEEAVAAGTPLKEKEAAAASKSAERLIAFNHKEVERRIAAIRAIELAEVESLLSRLRLIRSCISEEELERPALHFFQENMPNVSVVRNEEYKTLELKWKETEGDPGNMQVGGGVPLSVASVKSNFLDIANLQIADFVLDDPMESQMPGTRDALQTPGENVSRLSLGMTPKTLRLPKKGEMLMSVRGSPLGVYKIEENLEAIHETGDGSHEGTSQ